MNLGKYLVLSIIMTAVFAASTVYSATVVSESCSRDHIQAALNKAGSGDTVTVPAGICGWDTGISIPRGVRLYGAGVGRTVVQSSSHISIQLDDDTWLMGFSLSNGLAVPMRGAQNFVVKDCDFGNTTGARVDVEIDGVNGGAHPTGVFHKCVFTDVKFIVGGDNLGEEEWAYPDNLGGVDHAVYFEGCTFYQSDGASTTGSTGDSRNGAQMVWRFNEFYDGNVQTHGGRGGTRRGTRKVEFYRNTFHRTWNTSSGMYAFWNRGGVYIIFDNDCSDVPGSCDYYLDTPRVYEDKWTGGKCAANNMYDTTPHPATGADFACQDATGLGQDVNAPSPDLPADQHNQTYSPGYFWSNTYEKSPGDFHAVNGAQNFIEENRDYFLDASSHADFGLGGVTEGLWANRPVCSAGNKNHGYWAKDKGNNWNTTTDWDGEDGALYVCNGTGSWILYYTPATYPHPLVGSNSTDVLVPAINLRVNPR